VSDKRQRFERWFCNRFPCQGELLKKSVHHEHYVYAFTDNLWESWQDAQSEVTQNAHSTD